MKKQLKKWLCQVTIGGLLLGSLPYNLAYPQTQVQAEAEQTIREKTLTRSVGNASKVNNFVLKSGDTQKLSVTLGENETAKWEIKSGEAAITLGSVVTAEPKTETMPITANDIPEEGFKKATIQVIISKPKSETPEETQTTETSEPTYEVVETIDIQVLVGKTLAINKPSSDYKITMGDIEETVELNSSQLTLLNEVVGSDGYEKLEWESSDSSVATIEKESGKIRPYHLGKTTLKGTLTIVKGPIFEKEISLTVKPIIELIQPAGDVTIPIEIKDDGFKQVQIQAKGFTVSETASDIEWVTTEVDAKGKHVADGTIVERNSPVNDPTILNIKGKKEGVVTLYARNKQQNYLTNVVIINVRTANPDSTKLKSEIEGVKKKVEKEYSPASWLVFKQRLQEAEAVVKKGKNVQQSEITNALDALVEAKNNLIPLVKIDALDVIVGKGEGKALDVFTQHLPTGSKLEYTSSSRNKVIVDEKGYLKGVDTGNATISIVGKTSDGAETKKDIKVTIIEPVKEIQAEDKNVALGKTLALDAKADGDKPVLKYKSADETIVTVTDKGQLTGKKVGNTTVQITAQTADGTMVKKTVRVAVVIPVSGLEVKDLTIAKGKTSLLEVDTTGDKVKLSYAMKDRSIATISNDGYVTGKDFGTTDLVITAESTDGTKLTKTVKIKVIDRVTRLDVGSLYRKIRINTTYAIDPDYNGENTVVSYSSDSRNVSVGTDGVVTAVKTGVANVTVTAKTEDGTKLTKKIRFTVIRPVTSIQAVNQTLARKKSKKIAVKVNGEQTRVTFRSSNPKIATVTASGVVKGIRAGKTFVTITAKSKDGTTKTKKIQINVIAPVTKVTAQSKVVRRGSSISLGAKANGTTPKLTYKVSNKKIATVSKTGRVKGVRKGKTYLTVTAKTSDGTKKTKRIIIYVR